MLKVVSEANVESMSKYALVSNVELVGARWKLSGAIMLTPTALRLDAQLLSLPALLEYAALPRRASFAPGFVWPAPRPSIAMESSPSPPPELVSL